jgi:sigma-B regulation protein RsbU (phosphoserine phosphatase)
MEFAEQTALSNPYRIRCSEIWGGIRVVDTDVCTRGINASIFSIACGDVMGGDIYYFSVCSADQLSRVALADMRGHGTEASLLSGSLYEAMQRRMNTLDGGGVLRDLNEEVHRQGFDAMTTAAVIGYYSEESRLYFSNAGHPPVLLCLPGGQWSRLQLEAETEGANLPLGVFSGTRYDQEELTLPLGSRLFLYTDGLIECPSPAGEELGEEFLLRLLNETHALSISAAKAKVVQALQDHSGGCLTHDDCTFMVIEVTNDNGF